LQILLAVTKRFGWENIEGNAAQELLVKQFTGRLKPSFATEADRQTCCLKAAGQ
jgi:hypothetical protein